MKKDEAINILATSARPKEPKSRTRYDETVKMAIEALRQPEQRSFSCGQENDVISRQWLMECVNEGWIKFDTEKDANTYIHLVRDIAPSAQPEAKPPKWVAEDRFVKNRFAVYPHCPQCNADVTTGQCYCMICGQHIDWSEEDG